VSDTLRTARQFGTLIGLVALCLVLWITTPYFLTVSNLLNVVEQTSINAIVAVGMTFVILSAGIDLSVGSIVALAGVVLGTLLQAGHPAAVAVAPGGSLQAPMPGTVLRVDVREGQEVAAGEPLMVLEAMKMELAVSAPAAGTVTAVMVRPGDLVARGQVLAEVDPG